MLGRTHLQAPVPGGRRTDRRTMQVSVCRELAGLHAAGSGPEKAAPACGAFTFGDGSQGICLC